VPHVTTLPCFLRLVINRTPCVDAGFPFIKSIYLVLVQVRPPLSCKVRKKEEEGLGELSKVHMEVVLGCRCRLSGKESSLIPT